LINVTLGDEPLKQGKSGMKKHGHSYPSFASLKRIKLKDYVAKNSFFRAFRVFRGYIVWIKFFSCPLLFFKVRK